VYDTSDSVGTLSFDDDEDVDDDDPYADYAFPTSKPLSIIRESRELSARISDQVAITSNSKVENK